MVAEHPHGGGQQLGGGLLARGEQERRRPGHLDEFRRRSVRVLRRRQPGQDVVARVLPTVGEVGDELVVEPLERVQADVRAVEPPDLGLRPRCAQHVAELLVVLLGDTEQVGDHQQ
jgi:hypothetical protein